MPYTPREIGSLDRCTLRRLVPAVLLAGAALLLVPDRARAGDRASGVVPQADPRVLAARVELGRRLFFDPAASPSARRACASCHHPSHGFSDPKRLSADDFGITTRHSQTSLDGANNPSAHWDGEFKTVADLVRKRIGTRISPWAVPRSAPEFPEIDTEPRPFRERPPLVEGQPRQDRHRWRVHFTPTLVRFLSQSVQEQRVASVATDGVATSLESAGHYAEAFTAAYGTEDVTLDRIAGAIEAYCKTVRSTEAPVDRFLAGEERALSPAARRGLGLFRGRAGCVACHTMDGGRPSFTDYGFRNTGIAWSAVRRHHPAVQLERLGLALADARLAQQPALREDPEALRRLQTRGGAVQLLADRGRSARAGGRAYERTFKTPTLRDVAKRPPYMHDGSLRTLRAVVRYYAKGCCDEDPGQDARLTGFEASDRDVEDLVAFLRALSGAKRPGLARMVWPTRAHKTHVRLLKSRGSGFLANAEVLLSEEGDVLPVDSAQGVWPRRMKTDAAGWVEFVPGRRTHVRVRLLGDDDPLGGVLVPDSSRRAIARMPVGARATLTVCFPPSADAPDLLRLRYWPRSGAGSTVGLRRAATVSREAPRGTVTYRGWAPEGASPYVALDRPQLVDPLRADGRARLSFVLRSEETLHLDLRAYGWRMK